MSRLVAIGIVTAIGASSCAYEPKCNDRPGGLFANPIDLIERDGTLYVSNANNRNDSCYNFLTRLDRDQALDEESGADLPRDFIEVDPFPGPLASDPNGRYLYTVSRETDRLQVIDPDVGEIVQRVDIGSDSYNVTYLDDWSDEDAPALIVGSLDETFLRYYDLSDPEAPLYTDLDDDPENGINGVSLGAGSRIPQRLELDPDGGRGWIGYQQSYTDTVAMEIAWADGEYETRAFTIEGSDIEALSTDAVAHDPDADALWVAAQLSDSGDLFLSYGLLKFDRATGALLNLVALEEGASVRSMIIRDGKVFAAVYGLDQLWVLDAETGVVLQKLGVGDGPTRIVADSSGERLYLLNYVSDSIMIVDPDPADGSMARVVKVIE